MTELARPDVTVRQVLETTTTNRIPPVMRGCVVGPCNQVVEAQLTSSGGTPVLNTQARITLPAVLQAIDATGDPAVYSLPARGAFVFSVKDKPPVTMYIEAAGSRSPSFIVSELRKALTAAGETEAVAEMVGGVSGTAFRVRTVAKDEFQSLEIDPDGVAPASVTGNVDLTGLSYPLTKTFIYAVDDGTPVTITISAAADAAAVVAAIAAGAGITASLTSGDDYLKVSTDASGAGAQLEIVSGTLLADVGITAQVVTGTGSTPAVLSAFGFASQDYEVGASRYSQHELVIPPAAFPDPRGNLDELVFDVTSERLFSNTNGSTLREMLRTSAPLSRYVAAVTVIDDGDGDNTSPILDFAGVDLSTAAAAAVITGSAAPDFAGITGKTLIVGDGRAPRLVTFPACADAAAVATAINAEFDVLDGLQVTVSGGALRFTSTRQRVDASDACKGQDSCIVFYGGTVFTGGNDLDTGLTPTLVPGRTFGAPYPPMVGDEVFVNGVSVGTIRKVSPGGLVDRVRMSQEQTLTFTGANVYIVAKGLTAGTTTRPAPALVVEGDGQMVVKPALTRSLDGVVSEAVFNDTLITGKATLYMSYSALRLDVSNRRRGLLQLETLEQVEALLEPIDERNPLGLAAYMALQNSPRHQITALGIDEVSVEEPQGTAEAYARAAAHLEAFEVYGVAILTHSQDAADVFQTHCTTLSAPEGKKERLVLWCPEEPSEGLDTLVASGSSGNYMATTTFDTGVADLPLLLQEQDLDPSNPFAYADGVYLDVETDTKRYLITEVNGSVVTVSATFGSGENDDGYFSTTLLTDTLIDVAFGVRIRGTPLELTDGSPDLDAIADTYRDLAISYSDRRFWLTVPDTVEAVVGGISKSLPGYYAGACIAGMLTHYPVTQSFTNLGMSAINRVLKTSGRFTDKQLSRMAFGGCYILIQDGASLPVICRQAITTDSSSVEARMDIILKQVDLLAKLLRTSLRSRLGVTNISEASIDDINSVVQGVITSLVEAPVPLIKGVQILEVGLSPSSPDRLVLVVRAFPYYALNGIDITIYI